MMTDDLSIQISEELNGLPPTSYNHTIFKVPEYLRNVNKEAYEPSIVAIGPYHHDKDHLKVMEEQKRRYLKGLLERRKENNVDKYVIAMRNLECKAYDCYETEFVSLKTDDFVKMMLIDSCFIIELLRKKIKAKRSGYKNDDPILRAPLISHAVLRDLLLLENQLPFFVLRKFFSMTLMPDEKEDDFIDMIHLFFNWVFPKGKLPERFKRINKKSIKSIKHLVALLHDCWRPPSLQIKEEWEFIRCATELKEAGIKFKKVETTNLFEIKFENGVMKIPRLEISGTTETFFRNLIAYEQFILDEDINYVIDYIRFIDCLVNTPKDVELLCQCGIIHNCLGDDEIIANMINRLGDSVLISRQNFYYSDLFIKVNKYSKSRWNKRMAILWHKYFNSPWALISFVAALTLLLLTVAQTVFSSLSLDK